MDIASGTPLSNALDHLVGKTLDRDRAGGEPVEADDCQDGDNPKMSDSTWLKIVLFCSRFAMMNRMVAGGALGTRFDSTSTYAWHIASDA
jgi:hypothetical protein